MPKFNTSDALVYAEWLSTGSLLPLSQYLEQQAKTARAGGFVQALGGSTINFKDKTDILVLRRALQRFVDHTKLVLSRWPCPDCGRTDKAADVKTIAVLDSGEKQYVACWRCCMEPVLALAEEALKSAAKVPNADT